jgi:hypothetical protein
VSDAWLLALAQPAGLHSARIVAFFAFLLVLAALGFWLWRAKQQLQRDEAEALLEEDFRRLERELPKME